MKIWLDKLKHASPRALDVARYWFAGADWLAASPAEADVVVLFSVGYVKTRHWQAERARFPGLPCVLYSEADMPNLAIRGFFPSAYKQLPGRLPWPYLVANHPGPARAAIRPVAQRQRLFGFRGRLSTSPVRVRLQDVLGSEAVVDVGSAAISSAPASGHCGYCDELADTVFSLCPRGFGASSYRLYESMAQGCIPVIISDAFLPPAGPDWDAFSLRVSERDIADIPQRLAALAPRAEEMSRLSHLAWEQHFSPAALKDSFPAQVAWLLEAKEVRHLERLLMLFERYHLGAALRQGGRQS